MSFIKKVPGFRSGKVWKMVIAVIVYLSIIGGIYNAITGKLSTESTTAATKTETVSSPKPTPPAPQPFDFKTAEVTKENITKALSSVIPENQITNIVITSEMVNIYYNPGDSLSANLFVQSSAMTDVKAFEILYSNSKISKARLWTQGKLTDAKGNESIQDLMQVTLSRDSEKDINWKGFYDLVSEDYNKLLVIADDKFIHPAVMKELNS